MVLHKFFKAPHYCHLPFTPHSVMVSFCCSHSCPQVIDGSEATKFPLTSPFNHHQSLSHASFIHGRGLWSVLPKCLWSDEIQTANFQVIRWPAVPFEPLSERPMLQRHLKTFAMAVMLLLVQWGNHCTLNPLLKITSTICTTFFLHTVACCCYEWDYPESLAGFCASNQFIYTVLLPLNQQFDRGWTPTKTTS